MNLLQPKVEFLKDEAKAGRWQDIMLSPLGNEAISAALLAYSLELSREKVAGTDLTLVGVRMQGAQEFAHTLLNLGAHGRVPRSEETIQNLEPV